MKTSMLLSSFAAVVLSARAEPVANPQALRAWARAATSHRADLVMLGDSNQLYQAYGWNGGYINALRASCGLYATGLLWAGEGSGSGMGDGEGFGTIAAGSGGPFGFTTAPSALAPSVSFRSPVSQYLHLDQGSISGARNMGMRLDAALDPAAPLRWWLTEAAFPTAGSYQPTIRLGSAPYSTLASFGVISTGGGYGLRTIAYTLPAGPRSGPLEFRYAPYSFSPVMQGPLLFLWNRCEQVDQHGASVHTLFAWGGKSARWMAESIGAASDEFLTAYFSQVRRLQSGDVHVLVRISQGLNDSSETLPSYANAITPGNSPAAFLDNVDFTIARISQIWAQNQWPAEELSFLISVGHAVNSNDQSNQSFLDQYAVVAAHIAARRPNVAVIHLSDAFPQTEMVARGYYTAASGGAPGDYYHLSRTGYDALALFEVSTILNQGCIADINQDGGVDGADLETFFTAWANNDWITDANEDGGIDGADVESFFVHWLSGC